MTPRRIPLPAPLLLALSVCSLLLACHDSSGAGDASAPAHRLGTIQIPAAQTGQGPIPEVTDPTALAALPTTSMNSGFLAIAGTDVYAFSSTATIPTDAGGAAVGHAVVAGANGGTWLLVRSTSGTSLAVSQSGMLPFWTEGGTSSVAWSTAAVLEVNGTLLANAAVNLPNIPGMKWTIRNNCTGSFTLTIQANGGSGFAVAEGKSATGYIDDEGGATGNFVRVGPDT